MHEDGRGRRARGGLDTQQIEFGFQRGDGRLQHHGELGGAATGDHAAPGHRLGCDFTEKRRHEAERQQRVPPRQHRVQARPGRYHGGQAVRQFVLQQRRLHCLPGRVGGKQGRVAVAERDRIGGHPAGGLTRTEIAAVPPKDGIQAECFPGPPATATWISSGVGATR